MAVGGVKLALKFANSREKDAPASEKFLCTFLLQSILQISP